MGKRWRTLRAPIGNNGYRQAMLRRGGGPHQVSVLVLTAFAGPRPKGYECCHSNGISHDDRIENLRWDTRAGNAADKLRHGTHNRGERCGSAKLTERQVRAIRSVHGVPQARLAREHGVSQAQISQIRTGKRWGHL